MTDTLSRYGTAFQTKTIATLLTDKKFLEQTRDIISPSYFELTGTEWIVEKILWYFGEYHTLPTKHVLKAELDKETDADLRSNVVSALKDAYVSINATDLQYVKDEFLTFCKNQAVKNAVLKSADLLSIGKYDDIKSIVTKALQAGAERDFGHIWKTDIEDRLTKAARSTVSTGWDVLDVMMDGGLAGGELGLVIAPSGIGKSWVLSKIGYSAVRLGKKVVHYTFELNQTYTGLRYDTLCIGVEPNKIRLHRHEVERAMQSISGELAVKYFPTRTVTATALAADIQRRIDVGFTPDLIIIDYADLMRPTERSGDRYSELGIIYEDIRGMLGEFNIPGWTASQTQRSGMNLDVIEADRIADSFQKIMTSDFAMSFSRKIEDKIAHTGRMHVMKNRFGPDGITLPCEVNYEKGIIELYDENSSKGQMIRRQMQQGEGQIKQMLRQRLNEFQTPTALIEDGDDLG